MTDDPTPKRHDIWQLADKIQMDLRAAQAKLVELRSALAGLDLPDESKIACPQCGLRFKGERSLADHIYVSHDGPVPDVDRELDERVARAQTARLRSMVEQGGYAIEAEELERQLRLYEIDDEELVGLLELAADLRRGAAA